MQRISRLLSAVVLLLVVSCGAYAAKPTYDLSSAAPFASKVNVFNQSSYYFTVNATYMNQAGAGRKYAMSLYPYPGAASAILFPITLPEYAVYLQIVRNSDGYLVYAGYLSSDDVYIRPGAATNSVTVTVKHH